MQIGDTSRGIACWLYTNKKYGDQCVQFVQGLMPLDHWTEQPLGVLADAPGGDVERVALAADAMRQLQATNRTWTMEDLARAALSAMPDRQAAINKGLEMAAKVAEDHSRNYSPGTFKGLRENIANAVRAMKVEK